MRRLTNIVYVLGSLAFLGAIVGLRVVDRSHQQQIEDIAQEVRRFEQVIKLQAATNEVELTGRGWPKTVNPGWFGNDPPTNTLLSPDRPWVEVATTKEEHLLHPPNRIAGDSSVPMFWYNPYQGVIRTRVPPSISDRRALTLYNRLNRSTLPSIFARFPAPTAPSAEEPKGDASEDLGSPFETDVETPAPSKIDAPAASRG